MQTREIVGLTLIPIALLITAGTLNVATIGSVVWFCGLLASSVLILALLSFCCNFSPSAVPMRSLWLVYIAAVAVMGVGMIIRIVFNEDLTPAYRQIQAAFGDHKHSETKWGFLIVTGIYEWVSFAGVLYCVLLAARFAKAPPDSSTSSEGIITQR